MPDEPVVRDNTENVVAPTDPDYTYWRGLQAAQDRWEAARRAPTDNPALASVRRASLARDALWHALALEIATGTLSPRAFYEVRKAVKLAMRASSARGTLEFQEELEGPEMRRSLASRGLDPDAAMRDAYAEADAMDDHRRAESERRMAERGVRRPA